jgi:hypothetical protein
VWAYHKLLRSAQLPRKTIQVIRTWKVERIHALAGV